MHHPEKRKPAAYLARTGLQTGASDGNLRATYPTFSFSAMEFAAAIIGTRCHLPAPTARVVVELAQLGGQAS